MDARVYISELSTKPNDYKRVMTTLSKESMHEQRENHLPRLILLASGYVSVSIKPEGICVYHQVFPSFLSEGGRKEWERGSEQAAGKTMG